MRQEQIGNIVKNLSFYNESGVDKNTNKYASIVHFMRFSAGDTLDILSTCQIRL